MDNNYSKKTVLGPGWDHLFLTDKRSPEERAAADRKEWARRHGRRTKEWWKKLPPDPDLEK